MKNLKLVVLELSCQGRKQRKKKKNLTRFNEMIIRF